MIDSHSPILSRRIWRELFYTKKGATAKDVEGVEKLFERVDDHVLAYLRAKGPRIPATTAADRFEQTYSATKKPRQHLSNLFEVGV